MDTQVIFSEDAYADLKGIHDYITDRDYEQRAADFIDGILDFCNGLATFPQRGSLRNDIRDGLRVISYKRTTQIAFIAETKRITILGIFYGGRDYEARLK